MSTESTTSPTSSHEAWISEFYRAWSERDGELAGSLFTEDVRFYESAFGPPTVGREAMVEHWNKLTSNQADVEVSHGPPLVAGRRAAVEWWATLRVDGEEVTWPGCALIHFNEEGLATEVHEYSGGQESGICGVPEGWLR